MQKNNARKTEYKKLCKKYYKKTLSRFYVQRIPYIHVVYVHGFYVQTEDNM